MIGKVTPSQLGEMQAIYQKQERDSYYYSRDVDTTPDGRTTVRAGYDSGSCGEDGKSWVTVHDDGGATTYRYEKKSDRYFHHPTITPEGDRVYVEVEKNGSSKVIELPVKDAGPIRRLRGARAIADFPVDALQMSPDGEQLAMARGDGEILTWQRPRGFLGGMWLSSPKQIADVGEQVQDLHYLSDGSLFIVPREWQHRCYHVSPDGATVTRVPVRELDEASWKRHIKSGAHWLQDKELTTFLKDPGWLADDEGHVKPHVAARSLDGKTVAIAGAGEKSDLRLYDPGTGKVHHVADLSLEPDTQLRRIQWSRDGSSVLVAAGDHRAVDAVLADLSSGETWRFPALESLESVKTSPDGRAIATVSKERRSVSLWDRDTRAVRELPIEKETSSAKVEQASVQWSEQGGHAVVVSRTAGMKQSEIHVVSRDGGEHKVIPGVQKVRLEGDTIAFSFGAHEHQVDLPEGLATLEEQPWYVSPDTGLLFGRDGAKKEDLKVEQGDDHVNVGGIKVPKKAGE